MRDFKNKVVFVTGGASGIGLAMAEALGAQGARVVLADIDEAQLDMATARIKESLPVVLDVTDRNAWQDARRLVEARFGPVDILCNNAGIASDGRTLVDTDPKMFDRVVGISLTGTFNGISTFAAGMAERGSGHIVNTASLSGLIHLPAVGAYSAAKAGVVAISECLRTELAPAGVGVTIVCPGMVRTRISETTRKAGGDVPRDLLAPSNFRRVLEPEIVGAAVVEAIRDNQAYLITHAEFRSLFDERLALVSDGFGRAAAFG